MKSNILINCLVLFDNVGIFPSDILPFFILIDLHAYSEVFATEPKICCRYLGKYICLIIRQLHMQSINAHLLDIHQYVLVNNVFRCLLGSNSPVDEILNLRALHPKLTD